MAEECLLTSPLEPTNESYAIAKIAGIKMCQAYRQQHGFNAICAMPTNLYGPNDNYNIEDLKKAIILIDKRFETEASGGVNLTTIRGIAETGVDFISVGALTHSVKSLDISMLVDR